MLYEYFKSKSQKVTALKNTILNKSFRFVQKLNYISMFCHLIIVECYLNLSVNGSHFKRNISLRVDTIYFVFN